LQECCVEYKRDKKLGPDVSTNQILEKIVPSIELLNLAREIVRCEDEAQVASLLHVKSDYQAFTLFTRLTNLFVFNYELPGGNRRFKKGVYLFIDELDLLSRAPTKDAREANDLIRHIYDACPDCFCMVLGFTATSAELGVIFAPYVMSRVTKPIVLEFLQPDEAKTFIQKVLDSARIDTDKNTGYFPFSEDAVQMISQSEVSIVPRKIVNLMQQIIEEIRLAGINPADGLITTKVIDDNNIMEEVV
jgi:hypothetical protein